MKGKNREERVERALINRGDEKKDFQQKCRSTDLVPLLIFRCSHFSLSFPFSSLPAFRGEIGLF